MHVHHVTGLPPQLGANPLVATSRPNRIEGRLHQALPLDEIVVFLVNVDRYPGPFQKTPFGLEYLLLAASYPVTTVHHQNAETTRTRVHLKIIDRHTLGGTADP